MGNTVRNKSITPVNNIHDKFENSDKKNDEENPGVSIVKNDEEKKLEKELQEEESKKPPYYNKTLKNWENRVESIKNKLNKIREDKKKAKTEYKAKNTSLWNNLKKSFTSEQYAEKEVRWAIFFGNSIGFTFGLFTGILFCWFIWGYFQVECPLINGQICNAPFGYCTEAKVCNCVSALVSGVYCEQDACGDDGCGDDQECAPYLKAENVIDVCRWENPTPENNNKISTSGWRNPDCLNFINQLNYKAFVLGENLTDAESSSWPTCLCKAPNSGANCKNNIAPQNAALQICSNYGNKTIDYYENNSVGVGAQCLYPFTLLDYSLNAEMTEYIVSKYPNLLFEQYCGQLVSTNTAFYVKSQEGDVGCFCDEDHTGKICSLNFCPTDEFGQICSGNGAPNVGIGLEFNTSTKKNNRCEAICTDPFKLCKTTVDNIVQYVCKRDCAITYDVCPKDKPYRCRNEDCVDGVKTYQGSGEQGFNEYPVNRSLQVDGTLFSFFEIIFDSPLVAMIFPKGKNITVEYNNIKYNDTFNVTDRRIQNAQLPNLVRVIDDEYIVSEYLGDITLIHGNQQRTLINVIPTSVVTLVNESNTYFVFNDTNLEDNIVYLNDGSGLTNLENCFINWQQCIFSWNGTQYIPDLPTIYLSLQPFEVANKYTTLYGNALTVGYEYSVLDSNATIDSIPLYIFLNEQINENITFGYWIDEDLVKLDVCTPYEDINAYFKVNNNQSYFNKLWYNEYYRTSTNFEVGDYLVYFSFISNSWERGQFIGNSTVLNILKANISEIFVSAKKISEDEHNNEGLVECQPYLSFYKNKCVYPELIETQIVTNCFCPNGIFEPCTCDNGDIIDNTDNLFNASCSLYANGIYFPIRWIYKNGNYTAEAQNFNGTIYYYNNITEVYYGTFDNISDWIIGGYYPLGTLIDVTRTASSNGASVNNTNSSTNTYWEASSSDRNVFLNMSSTQLITSIVYNIHNNSIQIGNVTVIVPIRVISPYFEYSITTINEENIIYISPPSKWVSLVSPYPFSVYEFSAFTNQYCNETSTIQNISVWAIRDNLVNDTLVYLQTNNSCIFDGTCLLTNVTSMFTVNYSFNIIDYTVTKNNLKINANTCLLNNYCEDGTCTNKKCETRYNCHGNGCYQPDARNGFYKCACKEGWNGLACEVEKCKAIVYDITIFDETLPDPHAFCACGGAPPIKEKPSETALLRKRNIGFAQYLKNNRLGRERNNVNDVRNIYVKPDFAPYGVALTRIAQTGVFRFVTTCPYARKGPSGQYLLLDDDVETRDSITGDVTKWRTYFNYITKKNETIKWITEASFDDFPFRCPNGQCKESQSYCINEDICNGHGTCRTDGTCLCSNGWTTFIFTDLVTRGKSIPYYWDGRYNLTNPTIWGLTNTNWRDFSGDWCVAKDCNIKDCTKTALMGCFSGTPPDFKDRHVLCKDQKSCAANNAQCLLGNRTELIECSGNGKIKKRDYRDEYYCQCGYTETEKNGFGGENCNLYTCNEKLNREFSMYNKKTRSPYFNILGQRMRGKWLGFCGVHIGASPDDFGEWQQCCPGIDFTTCDKVPCTINGRMECKLAETCVPLGGIPKVYPCNHKGTPRPDGTCECYRNENEGTGYVPDPDIGEDNNCYKQIQCPISPITNTPCNHVDACNDPKTWTSPISVPFFNQQVDILLSRLKYSLSNESVILEVSNYFQLANQKLQAYEAVAIATAQAIKDIRFAIYVDNPDDTNYTFPIGMLPYTFEESKVILPYDKPFESPFILPYNGYAKLQNDVLTSLEFSELVNNTAYLQLPLQINFTIPGRIYAIRVHGRGFNGADNTTVRFLVNGREICPLVIVRASPWDWYEQYCDPIYSDFDYASVQNYDINCIINNRETDEICIQFKRDNCPDKYLPPNELHIKPRGCSSECCILRLDGFSDEYLQNVTIISDNSSAIVAVDQVQFYGFYNQTVRPVPINLFTEKDNCSATPDYRYASQFLGDDKSFIYLGESLNGTQANKKFQLQGAWLATTISSVSLDDMDNSLAQTCANGGSDKCLIGLYDTNRSLTPSNITEFFEPTCTAFGCYFDAKAELDMYGARNMSIYNTLWSNASQISWITTIEYINSVRSQLDNFPITLPFTSRYRYVNNFQNTVTLDINQALSYWLYDQSFNGPLNREFGQFYSYLYKVYGPENACNFWWKNVVPRNEPYLYDSESFPVDKPRNPNIFFTLTDATATVSPSTAKKISFQSNAGIYSRKGIKDYNFFPQPDQLACLMYGYDSLLRYGYCGTYGVDAFSYDFFGVDLIAWLDSFGNNNHYYNRFGPNGKLVRGNARNIIMQSPEPGDTTLFSTFFIFTVRLVTGQSYTYNVTLVPNQVHTFVNNSVLIGLQVLPGRLFNKYTFSVKGEEIDWVKPRQETMGWRNRPYEGMRVIITDFWKIENNQIYVNPLYPIQLPKTLNLITFFDGVTAIYTDFVTNITYRNLIIQNLTNALIVTEPSNYYGLINNALLLPTLKSNLISTAFFGRPIIECWKCEKKYRSKWEWFVHTYLRQGGFPKQATLRDSGIIINNMLDGTRRLDELNRTTDTWRWFTRQSVVNTLDDYLKTKGFAKDWCAVINSTSGKFDPIGCNIPTPSIGIRDYTKYVALPGRIGQYCGCSTRVGGFAKPGVTCIDEFPLANSTLYPFEHFILKLYNEGTLNLYVAQNPYDFDLAREFFFKNDKPIVWALTDAWDLWNNDFSDCPSTSISANPYDCLDFSLRKHFPHNCGSQYSLRTGEIARLCAREIAYCDADLIPEDVELRYYPGILSPVEFPSPKSLICAYSIRVSTYVVRDKYGGATPSDLNVLESEQIGSLKLLMDPGFTYVYNTGKPTYIFEGNLTYYGIFNFTAGTTGNYTIWVSPLSSTYLYPTTKIELYSGIINETNIEYLFNYNILQNATYQTIGFDFYVDQETIIIVSNVLVSNNVSLSLCQKGYLGQKRFEPPPVIRSHAPNNRCIYSKSDTLFFKKNNNIGQCACDHMSGGTICTCPAINRIPCGGPYGTCYNYDQCRCLDIGTLFYEKLLIFGTTDYFKVYVQDTVYNELAFVLLSNNTIRSLTQSDTLALTAATTLPSFVNGDEADDFLSLSARLPVFVDLTRENDNMEWRLRGIPFDWNEKSSLSDDIGGTNWTSEYVAAMNFDNLAFDTSNVLTNGVMIYYTNISTFSATVNENNIVYIFSFNASCTTANCARLNDITTANTYICSSGTVSFDVYNISEYQVYDMNTISLYI
jgi:hypothetical protein